MELYSKLSGYIHSERCHTNLFKASQGGICYKRFYNCIVVLGNLEEHFTRNTSPYSLYSENTDILVQGYQDGQCKTLHANTNGEIVKKTIQ